MKKITAIIPDDAAAKLNITEIFTVATEFHIEDVANGKRKRVNVKHNINGKSTELAIMDHYTPKGRFDIKVARKWLETAGYNPTSYSPALSQLRSAGFVERVSHGMYGFVKPHPQSNNK